MQKIGSGITISFLLKAWTLISLAQNVGVGTLTPQARLHVQIPATFTNPAFIVGKDGVAIPYMIITADGKVGIGVANPVRILHVADTPRFNSLASGPNGALVLSNPLGDLYKLDFPGDPSLFLSGAGTWVAPPSGGGGGGGGVAEPVLVYTDTATGNVLISSTTWTTIPGLSITFTVADTYMAIILTRGFIQDNITGNLDDLSPVQVAVFKNNQIMTNGIEVKELGGTPIHDPLFGYLGMWTQLVRSWNIHTFDYLLPGTYTFDVRARMYVTSFGGSTFDSFYAGGMGSNPTGLNYVDAEATLIILLIPV